MKYYIEKIKARALVRRFPKIYNAEIAKEFCVVHPMKDIFDKSWDVYKPYADEILDIVNLEIKK